jgi:asparagine synthase (glutamine-hydrolysing)
MCGLTGIARIGGAELADSTDALLRRMMHAVAHRGPDESVAQCFGRVGFGFVRLSLVDPAGGGQPLQTEDGSVILIANGEIYNHRELEAGLGGQRMRTGSDCEVLLHLYRRDGLRFMEKVRGMCSVIIWDRERNRLVFARDRFGIKPLFYHRDADRVVFASEMKALFQDPATPREIDWDTALADPLASGAARTADEPIHSWFRGIHLVPAATIVTIDLATGTETSHRYWDLPDYEGDAAASETELVKAYGEALADSVAECGMGDVEIGLLLSGGIDSASVAALAGWKPRTFSALNGSTWENGDAEYSHRVARSLGLTNSQVLFDTGHVPTVEEWLDHLWLLETPLAGPESFYKYEMYRHVGLHAPEIKGMMIGGGSDEFNGGYTSVMSGGQGWAGFEASLAYLGTRQALLRQPKLAAWWDQSGPPLLKADALDGLGSKGRASADYAGFHRMKYRDIQMFNCWHEDRTAGGNGIEARVPFLDHRLIELAAAVPPALRPELIWDKGILRRSMAGIVPDYMLSRPKTAFFYGDGVRHTYRTFVRMLAQQDLALVERALESPGAGRYLEADNVRAAVAGLMGAPDAGVVEFLLHAVNLALLEQMAADIHPAPLDSPRSPVAAAVEVTDWDSQRTELERTVLCRLTPDPAARLKSADNVLLVRDTKNTDVHFVAVNGAIEYVLSEREDGEWLRVLGLLDGAQPLADVLREADVAIDAVGDLLAQSLELGVIVETKGADHDRADR